MVIIIYPSALLLRCSQECKRRKVRCDKTVPCQPCRKLGTESQCALETVELSTKRTKSRQEIAFLRQLQLSLGSSAATARQDALHRINHRLSLLETGQEPIQSERSSNQKSAFSDVLNDQNDDAFDTAMALMRLGRGYPNLSDPTIPVGEAQNALSLWPSHLPEEQHARCLVEYYLENLSWHHNVLHHSDFLNQCEAFWVTGEVIASQWMSLYLAVLAVSIVYERITIPTIIDLRANRPQHGI